MAPNLCCLSAFCCCHPTCSERPWGSGAVLFQSTKIPEYGALEVGSGIAIAVGVYWLFQSIGLRRWAFWTMGLVGLLAQAPAILSHSLLDWSYFWTGEQLFVSGLSSLETGLLFLSSVILLVLLYKVIDLRRLRGILREQQAERPECDRFVINQVVVSGGLIAFSLMLTVGTVSIGRAIGGSQELLEQSPWAVMTIGLGATVLVAGFLYLWFQDRRQS